MPAICVLSARVSSNNKETAFTQLDRLRLNALEDYRYSMETESIGGYCRPAKGFSPVMTESKSKGEGSTPGLLRLASDIVSAYVSKNAIAASDLPGMIRTVHGTLIELEQGDKGGSAQELSPAVPIKKSVTPEHIICLEDGKKLKMLKRYLRSQYGLSPEEYRARWGLPADYPMVAPNYAAQRSRLAKQIGLGRTSPATQRGRRRK